MEKHIPYAVRTGRKEDFKVRYNFIKKENGELYQRPFQGMRCDFGYEEDDIAQTGIYMIWPEFENIQGEVIVDPDEVISLSGIARMWIVNQELKINLHIHKLKIGKKGYFIRGSMKIAEAEIVEIAGMNQSMLCL